MDDLHILAMFSYDPSSVEHHTVYRRMKMTCEKYSAAMDSSTGKWSLRTGHAMRLIKLNGGNFCNIRYQYKV